MKTILSLILTLATLTATAQIHVRPTPTGAGTGANWDNATTLETAVSIATSGTSIWIQAGTYNLSETLVIPQGVSVYGGFEGTETALEQRNFAQNRTILDANNNFAAVTMEPNSVLSGVTIQNGVANIPSRVDGGGVFMRTGSRLENSYIIGNLAAYRGGGIFAEANTEIFSSVIADNRAGLSGFAVSSSGEMLFLNNTVVGNIAVPLPMTGCNNKTPGWGESLGTVSFATSQTWIVGTWPNQQEWSDAVIATACADKRDYHGGRPGDFYADCRNSESNYDFSGHYFSWCAVMRFAHQLCPPDQGWRVPSREDFRRLHTNLTGEDPPLVGHPHFAPMIENTYMGIAHSPNGGIWGGARFTGWDYDQGDWFSYYWSSTERDASYTWLLVYGTDEVRPEAHASKARGFALRCVR